MEKSKPGDAGNAAVYSAPITRKAGSGDQFRWISVNDEGIDPVRLQPVAPFEEGKFD